MKLSQIQGTIEQRVILFGPPKVGKTELAGRLAEHYKILFFSLENGHVTLTKLPHQWQERIEVINIRDSRIYPIAIETMMKVVKGDECFICIEHSKVKCPICSKSGAPTERVCLNEIGLDWIVIIDSLTQFTNSGIAHITKQQPDDYKLQLDDWGALKVLIDKFLSQIQVAKYNVVCISHEEEVKFEDGRTKIVPVAGSSNSSRNTAKYFDHVVYCNVVNKKHVVGSATDYSMSVLTGSRTDVKMESNKEGGSLLDIFTNYKLPNYGMKSAPTEGESDEPTGMASNAASSGDSSGPSGNGNSDDPIRPEGTGVQGNAEEKRTPGQIALDNLRNKIKK